MVNERNLVNRNGPLAAFFLNLKKDDGLVGSVNRRKICMNIKSFWKKNYSYENLNVSSKSA